MSEFTDSDRQMINGMSKDLGVVTKQMQDLCAIMYGPKADGFLYEFATMRDDIKSIPNIGRNVETMTGQVEALLNKVGELEPRMNKVQKYIINERIRRGVLVGLVSAAASVLTFLLTIKSGLGDILLQVLHKDAR